jgi:hypothetical protein
VTDKTRKLATRYEDGAARGLAFIASQQLALSWGVRDEEPTVALLLDLEESRVLPAAKPPAMHAGALGPADMLNGLAAIATTEGELEVRKPAGIKSAKRADPTDANAKLRDRLATSGKAVRRFTRAGKYPHVRFADDGSSLFSASNEVLTRWDLKTGKAKKVKCHARPTHLAATQDLLAVATAEGLVCLFDPDRGTRLVCVRPTLKGWLAFDDDGAWDESPGFGRGAELSWTDAKSTAFVPDVGFGWLELNQFPLSRIVPATAGRTPGLLALRTKGRW